MKVTTKGQVTIPLEIRERLSIHAGTQVEFSVEGNVVRLVPTTRSQVRGKRVVERLRGRATIRSSMRRSQSASRPSRNWRRCFPRSRSRGSRSRSKRRSWPGKPSCDTEREWNQDHALA
jgi:AbrB family looped-hinge helix DNA binding protein